MERNVKAQDKNLLVYEYIFNQSEVAQAEETAIKHVAERVDIPGFRKGRAPRYLIRMRYPETIKSEMLEVFWQKVTEEIGSSEEMLLSPILEDFEINENGAKLVVQIHKKTTTCNKAF